MDPQIARHLRAGAMLRLATDLLFPEAELPLVDRFQLLEALTGFGLLPAPDPRNPSCWIQDACQSTEPPDEVTVLRRRQDGWEVGYKERGSLTDGRRFAVESDACRFLLHQMVGHEVVDMSSASERPSVRAPYRATVLAALGEVTTLARRDREADLASRPPAADDESGGGRSRRRGRLTAAELQEIDRQVRAGSMLRLATNLLHPEAELGLMQVTDLVEALTRFGLPPWPARSNRPYWVQGVAARTEPHDEVTIVRPDGDGWLIGFWERGGFDIRHWFSREGDLCRHLLHELVGTEIVAMGTIDETPYVRAPHRAAVLAALDEVSSLARRLR